MEAREHAQKTSVENLQSLYSLVVGLALANAVLKVARGELEPVPVDLTTLPLFLGFLVTLVPFYHGALRHLDATYIVARAKGSQSGIQAK